MVKEILWRPIRWVISLVLLPVKLLLKLVGQVISILISLVLFVVVVIALLMYFGWIPAIESLPVDIFNSQ